jgi:hypothetical protein
MQKDMRRGGTAETTRESAPGQRNRSFVSSLLKQPVGGHPQSSSATVRQAAQVELTDIYTTTHMDGQSNFSRQHR